MQDHLRIRAALREKSAVTIRQKRKRDTLQKNREYHLDILAHEGNRLSIDVLDVEEYQLLIALLDRELGLDLLDIDLDQVYCALMKLKDHSLLLDSGDHQMLRLVDDLVKDDLRLYRRLARLLYREEERNYLVLYFLVLYHKREKECSSLSSEDMNDLIINLVQVYRSSNHSNNTMFYASLLLQILYLSHPALTHAHCRDKAVLHLVFSSMSDSQTLSEFKQYMILIGSYVQQAETFDPMEQKIVVDFMEDMCVQLLKQAGSEGSVGVALFSVMGVICQVDKKHLGLVEELNRVVDKGQHLELLVYLLDKSLSDECASRRSENLNHVSYALKSLMCVKESDRQGSLQLMHSISRYLGVFLAENEQVQARTLEMLLSYLQQDYHVRERLNVLDTHLLILALDSHNPSLDKIIFQIMHRLAESEEGDIIIRVLDSSLFSAYLDRITKCIETESLLTILETLQSLLSQDHALQAYRAPESLMFSKQMQKHPGDLFDLLQEHQDEDVYQTTVAIMKQHFQWQEG